MNVAPESAVKFGALEYAATANEFIFDVEGPQTPYGKIGWAVDQQRRRALLVPIGEQAVTLDHLSTSSLALSRRRLLDGDVVVVRCLEPLLNHQFALLCDDLLAAIGDRPADPVAAVAQVLAAWHNLLAPPSSDLLSVGKSAGLIAELRVLAVLAQESPSAALEAWCGPLGQPHDFRHAGVAIEVKATTATEGFPVTVHGFEQLAVPDCGRLHLLAERFEHIPGGSITIPGLVAELVSAGVAPLGLFDRLAAVGYHELHKEMYVQERAFEHLETRVFEVTDDFPRLARDTLLRPQAADHIRNVTYQLDLAQLSGHSDSLPNEVCAKMAGQ